MYGKLNLLSTFLINKILLSMVSVSFISKISCNSHCQTSFTPLSANFYQPCTTNETLFTGFIYWTPVNKQTKDQTKKKD